MISKNILHPKNEGLHFNSCGLSPLSQASADAIGELSLAHATMGTGAFSEFSRAITGFRVAAGSLLDVDQKNISFVTSCAAGLNIVAHCLNFAPGDEIITYRYEYPSNVYPWLAQEERGVAIKYIEGTKFQGLPFAWNLAELESLITTKTKLFAISHVQFTSGFACDLEAIGRLCRERGVLFVVDAAQSLGCMPINPTSANIDVLVSSGWKWLMGPTGSAALYTTPELRSRLQPRIIGPDMMQQGDEYLDHAIRPERNGKFFEYSTIPHSIAGGLGAAINEIALKYGIDEIWTEVKRLQRILLQELDPVKLELAPLKEKDRSGILSFVTRTGDAKRVTAALKDQKIYVSARGTPDGKRYLRIAPHFFLSDDIVRKVAQAVNTAL